MMSASLVLVGGHVVCPELKVAETAPRRMKGLLGRDSLDPGEGLLLKPAGSVHTAFMRFPIDVVFVGADLEVLDVREGVPPWRVVASKGANAVVELPAGQAARRGIAPGARLAVDRPSEEAAGSPLVDRAALALGALGALLAFARFGFGSTAIVTACFLAALGVLAVVDLRHRLLPNRIVLPAAGLVLALQLALFPEQALEWVAWSLGCFAVLLALSMIKRGGIGMGDVKLGLLLGAGLGDGVVTALLLGFAALWPVAVWILLRDGADARARTLPLGPALAFGAAVVALAG